MLPREVRPSREVRSTTPASTAMNVPARRRKAPKIRKSSLATLFIGRLDLQAFWIIVSHLFSPLTSIPAASAGVLTLQAHVRLEVVVNLHPLEYRSILEKLPESIERASAPLHASTA